MISWTDKQKEAIFTRDKNIIVSASAGSGKTSVMIERIVQLILEGYSLEDMLIVTFTRASSLDMKDKLAKRLSAESILRARVQQKRLAFSDIGTLHSFCQKLIGEYFYKTDLDPDFTVIENAERNAVFEECLNAIIEEEYSKADSDFLQLIRILGGHDEKNLKSVLREFYDHLITLPQFDIELGNPLSAKILAQNFRKKQADYLAEAQKIYQDILQAGFTRNINAALDLIECIKDLKKTTTIARGSIPEGFYALNEGFKKTKDRLSDFLLEAQTLTKAGISVFEENQKEIINPSNKYLKVLFDMARTLRESFLRAKKARARIDFNDLEHYALDILKSEEGKEIRKKYKFVFVDEYQDINPLQNEIIDHLKSEGNLFLVGDLKQSIYAFRGCEPTVFTGKIAEYSLDSGCKMIELNTNHRSSKGILHYVNSVFNKVMTQDFGGTDYEKTGRFVVENDESLTKNEAVKIYLYQKDDDKQCGIYSVADDKNEGISQAADIAFTKIIGLLNSTITQNGITRPVVLKDIAVLVRSASQNVFDLIKRLKDEGLNAALSDSLRYSFDPCLKSLLSYLTLIDNRLNDVALINSLKSSFGGFDDNDLIKIRAACKDTDYFYEAVLRYKNEKSDELSSKLNKFYDALDSYLLLSKSLSVATLVGKIVTDFRCFHQAFMLGDEAAQNLETFINMTITCNISSLTELVNLSFSLPSVASEDAINIMTVHSSKGLEFPFVIILSADKKFNLSDLNQPIIPFKQTAAITHFDWDNQRVLPSADWLFNKQQLKKRQKEEEMRLLYVAITRAKYGVYIIAGGNEDKCTDHDCDKEPQNANSWLDWLMPIPKRYLAKSESIGIEKKPQRMLPLPDEKLCKMLENNLSFKPKQSNIPPKTYVTALLNSDKEEDRIYIAGGDDDRSGQRGTLYHKAMELLDFSDFSSFDLLDPKIKQEVDKNAVLTAASIVKNRLAGYTLYKEQAFIADLPAQKLGFDEDGSILVQGIIDLIAIKDDKKSAIIIDYKTGSVTNSHKKQLDIYSYAAQKILGLNIEKQLIYSFRESKLIEL